MEAEPSRMITTSSFALQGGGSGGGGGSTGGGGGAGGVSPAGQVSKPSTVAEDFFMAVSKSGRSWASDDSSTAMLM